MNTLRPRPIILIVLDGWGYREAKEANAIAAAHTPYWDTLWQHYPHTYLCGSGCAVGLPEGQMGNSEVGHLTMGAGRRLYQDLTRIDMAIEQGDFFLNPIFVDALSQAKANHRAVHVMGLLSPGGVHSHERHLYALLQLAAKMQLSEVYLHVFLDGRDTPPQSAEASLRALESICANLQCGKIVSMVGRYYAMDRDKRWDRIQKAYDLLTEGKADYHTDSALDGLAQAYRRGESDEFVLPTAIHPANQPPIYIKEGDTLFFMNFRSDRAREITEAFTSPHFQGFTRSRWPVGPFISLCEYDIRLATQVAFPPQPLQDLLGSYISQLGLKQLRIAETEKYAHVTFFFNGGIEQPSPGEDRILIPSPQVATYDLKPEMSAFELTERLIQEINCSKYDLIICNFANPDMVGHTGDFHATIQAIETIDTCLGKLIPALLQVGGEALITADHGNAELMFDAKNNQVHTAHTADPVPFLYIGRPAKIIVEDGNLYDIAPTLLYLMGLPQPDVMTGHSLLALE